MTSADYSHELIMLSSGSFVWRITETRSQNLIGVYSTEEECVNRMIELLSGSPFEGWTPRYILTDVKKALANTRESLYNEIHEVEPLP